MIAPSKLSTADAVPEVLSVVIPTRHRNASLAACLARLAPGVQSLPADRYEVIVTDDGSATTAEAMVKQRFPWARWTAGPRRGPAANRNHGASVASGEWLVFTDDDCLPSVDFLAAYANAITHARPYILEGKTTCNAGIRPLVDEAPINLYGGNLWSCNMALTRDAFERSGRFDERFPSANAEDLEFHDRIRQAGIPAMFVPEAVVDHPPRRLRSGVIAGRLWEGRALLKTIRPETLLGWMPLHVAKVRASQMMDARLSNAWVRFAWSSIIEVMVVAVLSRKWLRHYAGERPIVPQVYREVICK